MQTRGKIRAFTVLELLVLVVVVFILGVLFLMAPCPGRTKQKAVRINCVCNLKQVGLAFRLWEDDNQGMSPMQSFTNETGSSLYADATSGFRYFQAMSNELVTPKLVVCPADKRAPAMNFTTDFSGAHLSYFVGLDADVTRSSAFLGGDRNITNGQTPIKGILEARTNQNIGWTSELHNEAGNILFADGSVWQLTQRGLNACLTNTGLATNRLLLPP